MILNGIRLHRNILTFLQEVNIEGFGEYYQVIQWINVFLKHYLINGCGSSKNRYKLIDNIMKNY